MEYTPLNLDEDIKKLINSLMETGRLAGNLVSRAALEHGNEHPVTAMFDAVAQRITVTLLELQIERDRLKPKQYYGNAVVVDRRGESIVSEVE